MHINKLATYIKRLALLMIVVVCTVTSSLTPHVSALSSDQKNLYKNNILYYDIGGTANGTCSTTADTSSSAGASNLDYAGNPILTQGELAAIATNQPVYQAAATQVGIPWQMLAVIHLRESGLKVANPANGQGIFQFADEHGGPYPTGPVTQAEFSRQAVLAAQFLQSIASGNYDGDQTLTADATANTIKDTFFSYNGRASVYASQAATLGYSATTQGYEGSPYVMNKADAKRDPASNPTGWGQIKTDGGALSYPANDDYGAYVTYAALTGGLSSDGSCLQTGSGTVDCNNPSNATQGLSPVRQDVVCLAEQELALWKAGTLKRGSPSVTGQNGFGKYSQGRDELWCADFTSWIFDQAKYPLQPDPDWDVPLVDNIKAIGEENQNFHYHDADGYTPKPGDLIIHLDAAEGHVNIVAGVSGTQLTELGGDQDGETGGYPDGSGVTEYTENGFSGVDNITGYVSPD